MGQLQPSVDEGIGKRARGSIIVGVVVVLGIGVLTWNHFDNKSKYRPPDLPVAAYANNAEPSRAYASYERTVSRTSWIERAESALRTMLNGKDGSVIAQSVLSAAHPAGMNPVLGPYSIRRMGDRISVRMTIFWEGRMAGGSYRTDLAWEFSEQGHISTTIIGDNSVFGVNASERAQVNDWFRAEVYPVLYRSAEG